MDEIPNTVDIYKNKEFHEILALRNIRPHYGAFLEETDIDNLNLTRNKRGELTDESIRQLHNLRESYDTSGIDIMLGVLRFLTTFGYTSDNIPGPNSAPGRETIKKLMPFEKLFMVAAMKDFGWHQEKGWKMKRELIESLSSGSICKDDTSFLALIEKMESLFKKHPQFHFVDKLFWNQITNKDGSAKTVTGFFPRLKFLELNELKFDDSSSLSDSLTAHFHLTEKTAFNQSFCYPSTFLRIHYKVTTGRRTIADIRKIFVEVPGAVYEVTDKTIPKVTSLELWKSTYVLAMVVNITPGRLPNLRKYWKNGQEMLPDQVGQHDKKFPCTGVDGHSTLWSIRDIGEYMLFYYREDIPDGWDRSEMNVDAPETSRGS
ncbi:hypothetical protein BTUL_0052g00700 [Botrytis tulipae]|uniref:USP domain-containing protein n=1 Tax=Botrytis tulipae TaxID=87230 RepID=A0A4Z1EUM3_9HELO|nr:hypothetical protein BTUL_0052g00700 [Botrytis tulipae]